MIRFLGQLILGEVVGIFIARWLYRIYIEAEREYKLEKQWKNHSDNTSLN